MRGALILAAAVAASLPGAAAAHAIFPGTQKVQTLGERAFVQFHAVNARKDVSNFVVEIFDHDWVPSRIAVATPKLLNIPAQDREAAEAVDRPISVLVDLDGKLRQRLRVCTKSVTDRRMFAPRTTEVATRVCANVTVERFAR